MQAGYPKNGWMDEMGWNWSGVRGKGSRHKKPYKKIKKNVKQSHKNRMQWQKPHTKRSSKQKES